MKSKWKREGFRKIFKSDDGAEENLVEVHHSSANSSYWQACCLPEIEQRCTMVHWTHFINDMLGFNAGFDGFVSFVTAPSRLATPWRWRTSSAFPTPSILCS
jgi:hypothetical protein